MKRQKNRRFPFFFLPQLFVALPRPLPTQANPPLSPRIQGFSGSLPTPALGFPAGCDSRNAPQLFKSHSGSRSRENGRAGASLRADPSLPGQEIPRKAWKSHPAAALPCKKPFLEKPGKRHQILRRSSWGPDQNPPLLL